MIAVIDYKVVNLGSMINMLKKIGVQDCKVVETAKDLSNVEKIIFPGVGSYSAGCNALDKSDLREPILALANSGIPVLGVCLGMQLLGHSSEEGEGRGLGLIDGVVKRIPSEAIKIPHMGWNHISIKRESPLISSTSEDTRFYFVHSYYFVPKSNDDVLFTVNYGKELTAGVNTKNIYGVQFHPEKSHRYGMEVLKNFIEKC